MVKDPEDTGKYINTFSKIMRMILSNAHKKVIPLTEELRFIEMYLNIERTRFEEKFDFEIKIDSNVSLEHARIPPMLTQPFVDNALWHGLMHKESKGLLTIKVIGKGENIQFRIADNGVGWKATFNQSGNKTKETMGKEMIDQRIRVFNNLYNLNLQVSIEDRYEDQDLLGTEVILTIPTMIQKSLNEYQ